MAEVGREVTLSYSPPQAGPPKARVQDGFWVSPKTEILQPLWATSASALSSSQWKCAFLWSDRASCVSVCAPLWSCRWAPLKRAWLRPSCTLPSGTCTHWWDPARAFSSLGYTWLCVLCHVTDGVSWHLHQWEEYRKCLSKVETADCKWNMKQERGEEQVIKVQIQGHPGKDQTVCEKSKITLRQNRKECSSEMF